MVAAVFDHYNADMIQKWKGNAIYHCHLLLHEDSAMIKSFLIS